MTASKVSKKTKKPVEAADESNGIPRDVIQGLKHFKKQDATSLKILSYNVAGISAALKKGLKEYLIAEDADIVLLQETKLNTDLFPGVIPLSLYPHQFWNHCTAKKSYSGVAILSKIKPVSKPVYGIGDPELDSEGRFITLEFANVFLVGCYVINAGSGLVRLDQKRKHYLILEKYLKGLQQSKPIIWAGDLNVAHHEIDLARPKGNLKTPGFTVEEREDFGRILTNLDLVDSLRSIHGDAKDKYTYYSYRFGCYAKNIGWRLDYFIVSQTLVESMRETDIRKAVYGASDHVPLYLILDKSHFI